MKWIVDVRNHINRGQRVSAVLVLCTTTAMAVFAQSITTIYVFDGIHGQVPNAGLVQAVNGDFYGTTAGGGNLDKNGVTAGTVFKITPAGTLTTLYNFCAQTNCTDGESPNGWLVQATNGYLYGTTFGGGLNYSCGEYGCGTIFKIDPSGTLKTVYGFCALTKCADGLNPEAGLVQAANGDVYGTTFYGGSHGTGTIFKGTPNRTLTTMYNFCSQYVQRECIDGYAPIAGIIQGDSGDFYGTTYSGGANCNSTYSYNCGTIFKITKSGTLTTLHTFCSQPGCADGQNPQAALVQGRNGDFYGTTLFGGNNCNIGLCGTVFKITPNGTLTTLYRFCSLANCEDGGAPGGALIRATDGNLYGTTRSGGTSVGGTIFKIDTTDTLTTIYNFCSQTKCADGAIPRDLVQATNGDLYGTTGSGGLSDACPSSGCGTVFRLSLGLGPFVKTLPTSGLVGERVRIFGYNLTGATSVSFNGTAAVFSVVSSTEITATVPATTTGKVEVVTPVGTLSSNVSFLVL